MRLPRGLLVLALAALAGCNDLTPTYDSFPIPIDLSTGVPLWRVNLPASLVSCGGASDGGVDAGSGDVMGSMAIDLGEPLTVLEFCQDSTRTFMNLEVRSAKNPAIKRARFDDLAVINLPATQIGLEGGFGHIATVQGLVGKDLLSSFSVRFVLDPANPFVQLFPETAGANSDHAAACEAVVPYVFPTSGFNAVIVNGTQASLTPSRIIVSACFDPHPFRGAADLELDASGNAIPTGVDLSLVLSTGVEPIVLGASARARIDTALAHDGNPVGLDVGRPGVLHVASGPIPVKLGTTRLVKRSDHGRVVLVEDADPTIGPCAELAIARQLEVMGACGTGTCTAASYVELERPLELAEAPDETSLLQDVRSELRLSSVREIDGFLGAEALRDVVLDVHYPHDRLVMRCADGRDQTCHARPHFTSDVVSDFAHCLPLSQPVDGGIDAAATDAAEPDATEPDAGLDASD